MKGLLKKLCDFTFKSLTDESDTKSEKKSEDQTDQSKTERSDGTAKRSKGSAETIPCGRRSL